MLISTKLQVNNATFFLSKIFSVYKWLWSVGDKSRDLSVQDEVLHAYTFKLG